MWILLLLLILLAVVVVTALAGMAGSAGLSRAVVADGAGLKVSPRAIHHSVACLCGGVLLLFCVPDGPFLVPLRPLNCFAGTAPVSRCSHGLLL